MLSVYQNIKNIGGEISPEIRGVFDRMLATDDAIKQAETLRSYAPLFDNAKAAGMSMADFNAYLSIGQEATDGAIGEMQARSLKDMKWASNAKSRALKDLQKQASAARKEARAQVEQEVEASPAFAAQSFMATNPGKVDAEAMKQWNEGRESTAEKARAAVKAELSAANPDVKGLQKGQLFARNKKLIDAKADAAVTAWERTNERPKAVGGADPDIVAGKFGFESGDAMRRAIMEAGSKKDAIDLLTDHRMLAEHGELLNTQSVEMAANEAVHNEARARFMATGLKILTKSPLPANQIAKAAKQAADGIISAKTVGRS